MTRRLHGSGAVVLAAIVVLSAAGCTVYTRPAPPPPVVEVRPVAPHPTAKWVPGHQKWSKATRSYVWVPGHWK